MATFTWSPDIGAEPKLDPRKLSVRFGEGYEQRAPDGLNPLLSVWDLNFSGRSLAEVSAIYSFLASNQAWVTAFDWAAPGEGLAVLEQFGIGDGSRTAWNILPMGRMGTLVGAPTVYRTDWQGTVQLYNGARTNRVINSQAFNLWSNSIGGTGVNPGVATDSVVAPDGTTTADNVSFNAGAGTTSTDRSMVSISVSGLTGASPYVGSIWVKGTAGTKLVMRHVGGNTYTILTLDGTWQRLSNTETSTGTTGSFEIGIRQGVFGTINAAATVALWGAQIEAGIGSPGSYIPTTTVPVTATDYTLSGTLVTMGAAPVSGAVLSWSGSYVRKYIADTFTTPKPGGGSAWSISATFREVPL